MRPRHKERHHTSRIGWTRVVSLASATSFAIGVAMPLFVTFLGPESHLILLISGTSIAFLALFGGIATHVGGAPFLLGAASHFLGSASHVSNNFDRHYVWGCDLT